jgi:glyoxylase-like metal-dependent hydrolase (beta-lactamase superfamily II)
MTPVPTQPIVHPFHHRASGTWSYVVAEVPGGACAIVDPVLDFDPAAARTASDSAAALLALAQAQRYDVRWILETHAHADHLSAAQWLKAQQPGATLAIGSGIAAVQRHFAPLFGFGADEPRDGAQFDRLWRDEETFALGALAARTIPVPGHTPDSLAYLIGDALFCGDTLFMPDAGTARCDFPGGDAATLYRSIRRMYALPDATRVFVCHDYGPGGREPRCETTIAAQKRDNIHVRDDTGEAEFVRVREARDATLTVPQLLLPALQVNLRAGNLPPPEPNGVRYLRLPLDLL